MNGGPLTFREQALRRFVAAFGPPREVPVQGGSVYRRVLERPRSLSVYVTLNSPEMTGLAHVLVSDPRCKAGDPLASVVLRTLEEVEALVERVRRQWQSD
jgi:hypothetical protein